LQEYEFCKARVQNVLALDWFEEVWRHPSIHIEKEVPPLKPEIIQVSGAFWSNRMLSFGLNV
jgi:hypothetical protein